jgi:Rhomboid family
MGSTEAAVSRPLDAGGPRTWVPSVLRYIGSAPLTYSWLTVLAFTTLRQQSLPRASLQRLLLRQSTNLHHLLSDPIHVLLASLLWIDGRWWPYLLAYLLAFTVFVAPAERWLGWWRWIIVGLVAHIVATYVSEGVLYLFIAHADPSRRVMNARDIGVSYFLVGIIGVLTYRIARPWRWVYLAVTLLVLVVSLAVKPGFTPVGHLCALVVGLAMYPITRSRDRTLWSPVPAFRRLTHSRPPAA